MHFLNLETNPLNERSPSILEVVGILVTATTFVGSVFLRRKHMFQELNISPKETALPWFQFKSSEFQSVNYFTHISLMF